MKYNLGNFLNFKEIFGENIFLWLIPYSKSDNDNLKGYSFKINDDFYNDSFDKKEESKSYYTSNNSNSFESNNLDIEKSLI